MWWTNILKVILSLLNREALPPVLKPILNLIPIGTIDINLASSILLDKIEEIGQGDAEIYLPDDDIKKYRKQDVIDFLGLDETDKIPYVKEKRDCDDFSAELFGKFAGLVWTTEHALNFFFDEADSLFFIEPQQDKLARDLESWQGLEIRFFLGR